MKIAFITYEDLSQYNGAVVQLIELSESLVKLGHRVQIYNLLIGHYPEKVPFEIKYVYVINRPTLRNITYSFFSFFFISYYLCKFKPDCVIFSEYYLDPVPTLLCLLWRTPMVFFVNGIVSEDLSLPMLLKPFMWLINLVQGFHCRNAKKILAITEEVKFDLHIRHNIPLEKIEVVHDGVDPDKIKPLDATEIKQRLNLSEKNFIIGFVGGLFRWHGLDYLIKAAPLIVKEIKNVRFVIIGEGKMKNSLLKMARDYDLENYFIFTGHLHYSQIPLFISAFDICVSFFKGPRKNPGDPIKTYEYLACRKPVIASNVKGYGDFVESIGAGISVDTSNPEEVANAIVKLLKDRTMREEMGKRGREGVVKNHTWLERAKQIEKSLQEVLSPAKSES